MEKYRNTQLKFVRLFVPGEEREAPCSIMDMSAGGAQVTCEIIPTTQSAVVLYIDGFGRFEGSVVRAAKGEWSGESFGVRFNCSAFKRERVAEQLSEVFASHGVPAQINGVGSLLAIHFSANPVVDYRAVAASDKKRMRDFFLALVNHGVLMAPRGMGAISTPMDEDVLQRFVDAVDEVVGELKPAWGSG